MPTTITGTDGVSQVQTGAVESGDLPAGSVIQVVQSGFDTETVISSTSYVAVGLSASITPASSSSKVLVFIDFLGSIRYDNENSSQVADIDLRRNGTSITERSVTSRESGNIVNQNPMNVGLVHLDNPNAISTTTYELFIRVKLTDSSGGFYFNQFTNNPDATSTITLMEIAG